MMWIDVKKERPEVGVEVWCCPFEDYQQVGWYVETVEYSDGPAHLFKNVFDRYIMVQYWMPLPERP